MSVFACYIRPLLIHRSRPKYRLCASAQQTPRDTTVLRDAWSLLSPSRGLLCRCTFPYPFASCASLSLISMRHYRLLILWQSKLIEAASDYVRVLRVRCSQDLPQSHRCTCSRDNIVSSLSLCRIPVCRRARDVATEIERQTKASSPFSASHM